MRGGGGRGRGGWRYEGERVAGGRGRRVVGRRGGEENRAFVFDEKVFFFFFLISIFSPFLSIPFPRPFSLPFELCIQNIHIQILVLILTLFYCSLVGTRRVEGICSFLFLYTHFSQSLLKIFMFFSTYSNQLIPSPDMLSLPSSLSSPQPKLPSSPLLLPFPSPPLSLPLLSLSLLGEVSLPPPLPPTHLLGVGG